jgi:DNA replication and repair protein RecF
MILSELTLRHFKNHQDFHIHFSKPKTIICGNNGTGKTNLLDAIYYLSLSKSAFHSDKNLVQQNQLFFRIEATYQYAQKVQKVVATYTPTEKKFFSIDHYAFETLAEYIGHFPVILIAPNDTDLIREGSEIRRKFFDTLLCQINKMYLQKLSEYNKLLKQRNALLTHFREKKIFNPTLVEVYDEQLLPLMDYISQMRTTLIQQINTIFQQYYTTLAQSETETVHISYVSNCQDSDFKSQFKNALAKDAVLERTTLGIHKDDYDFLLKDHPIKKFGSQGQQKTFVIALKFATFEVLRQQLGITPIVLLDDILDKLDEHRTQRLLNTVAQAPFEQVIITEANALRVEAINHEKLWDVIRM